MTAYDGQRRNISIGDGGVSVLTWPGAGEGGGRSAIHFAHANGFNAQTYAQLLAPLAKGRDVFASDLRGHGRTTLPADPALTTNWAQYATDIAETLKQLPGAPFVLGGHSMGATASLVTAARNPGLVRGLVLAEPVILPRRASIVAAAAKALGFYDRIMPMAAQAKRRRDLWPNLEAAFEAYRGRGAFKSWAPETLRDYLNGGLVEDPSRGGVRLACAPEWEAANYRAGPPWVHALLASLRIPVVLLTGGRRSTCPPGVAQTLQKRAKDLKWFNFPECSHFLPMERPDTVADSLHTMAN